MTASSQQEGHLVIVTVSCTDPTSTARPSTSKSAPKRRTNMKNASIVLVSSFLLVTFSKETLGVHELDEVYAIGPVAVPPFKMHWTGISKSSASIIEREGKFQLALHAIMKKRGATIYFKYNLNNLEGFRAQKCPADIAAGRDNTPKPPVLRTQVPNINELSKHAQVRGEVIQQLEKLHACTEHLGEHSQPGACAKTAAGHICLNLWRKRIWADAIIPGSASLEHPPHCSEFNGQRNGCVSLAKPRGRTGPNSAVQPAAPANATMFLPLLTTLIGQQHMMFTALMGSRVPTSFSALLGLESASVAGGCSLDRPLLPFLPPALASCGSLPGFASNIFHFFLLTLLEKRNIDVLDQEELLTSNEMTPGTLSSVPITRLMEITNLKEGPAWQLVDFAHEYTARLRFKRQHALPYNPDDEFCISTG
ncbi:hypothetical protein BC835DRAFT_1296108 [Cytidiella melzeri]|nr:hypothetical protein BC835DRAFT_1296108 [Cytidiella melzeri]